MVAKIAVIGAGWWGQGWHIPAVFQNPDSELVAIVDQSENPQSDMDPNLISLTKLGETYNTKVYYSLSDMLDELGPVLDGVIISTPHATHYRLGRKIYDAQAQRNKTIHVMMEKPMATDMEDAKAMVEMVKSRPDTSFWINHSANFRPQAVLAQKSIAEGRLGTIRHVTCSMASPVQWVFNNPDNKAWNQPQGRMLANGFAWGQSCHLLGWVFFVCGDTVQPEQVFCAMNHQPTTGADMAHSATILCSDQVVLNVSGTAWLPGSQYATPRVGKPIRVQIYGTEGALLYEGDDANPQSGRLELRRGDQDGSTEILADTFLFEDASTTKEKACGADSVANFVQFCCGNKTERDNCANVDIGFKTIQTIEAMYRSHHLKTLVDVVGVD